MPATFAHHHDELGEIATDSMTDHERREAQEALHARYGLTFHWDGISELAGRYGVKP